MRRLRVVDTALADESEALYACTGCGACTTACLHHVEPGIALMQGRDEAVQAGRGHPALADLPARFAASSEAAAAALASAVPAARRSTAAQVAFLPGCEAPQRAATMLRVADRLGAEYLTVAEVRRACAGYPLYAGGRWDAFRLHAERFAAEVAGHARLIVHCAACAWLLKVEYRRFGVPVVPRVEHSVEFLDALVDRLPVKRPRDAAYYHDACYLGRRQGLYDPPRRILGKVAREVREFSRARAESECCGGGGLVADTMPETAALMAERRLAEVREAPAPVVSACGSCARQLARDGVESLDLIDLLAEVSSAP